MNKAFITIYIIGLLALFFYSFTQIDLGLTLTRASIWQELQRNFQYIGYFNRQLSTQLFISTLILLFIGYIGIVQSFKASTTNIKLASLGIALTAILLFVSYNAFSYDLFNYVFDAKIITHYNQNPYEHKALDFPGDPMLGFMRWTHRVYPYGPAWLGLTIPLSYAGMGYLLPTLLLFKGIAVGAYIGVLYFINKISKKIGFDNSAQRALIFALSPLVIIESLVSAHNDIVMMVLAVAAVYYYIDRRVVIAVVLLLLSIGIKFATVFLIPGFVVYWYYTKKKHAHAENMFINWLLVGMAVAIVAVTLRTNFQPWYLLYVMPFIPLLKNTKMAIWLSVVLALFTLIQYIPFLYTGNWDPPIPTLLFWDTLAMAGIAGAVVFAFSKK